jgi:hypothetical protein
VTYLRFSHSVRNEREVVCTVVYTPSIYDDMRPFAPEAVNADVSIRDTDRGYDRDSGKPVGVLIGRRH